MRLGLFNAILPVIAALHLTCAAPSTAEESASRPHEPATIRTVNEAMFSKMMTAQQLRGQGRTTEAVAMYHSAMAEARNKNSNPEEFQSYIHSKSQIAALYLFPGGTPSVQERAASWDKAIQEYSEILSETAGHDSLIDRGTGMPLLYALRKEAEFHLAVLRELKGGTGDAAAMLERLATELRPYKAIIDRIRSGDKSVWGETVTVGDTGITTLVKCLNPQFYHSLGCTYVEVEDEIKDHFYKRRVEDPPDFLRYRGRTRSTSPTTNSLAGQGNAASPSSCSGCGAAEQVVTASSGCGGGCGAGSVATSGTQAQGPPAAGGCGCGAK